MELEKIRTAVEFIKSKTSTKPRIGLVLGSGLGAFINNIDAEISIPYREIPNFNSTSVEGHSGNLIFGKISEIPIVALQGRIHYYEGYSMEQVVLPTRVLAVLGVRSLVLTNSAGGLLPTMVPGDFMVIEDHINLMGANPLMGPNLKELGPRFPDLSEAYDKKYVQTLEQILGKLGYQFHKGVYGGISGPTYETPAEVRYLRTIGCSAVGMSTVPEAIAANHLGVRVAALSCITNLAAGLSTQKLSHKEVTDTANRVEKQFATLLSHVIGEIGRE